MTTLNRNPADRDERLGQVISACLRSMESGRHEELADWQARYPDFALELAEFYAIHRQVEQLAAPLRDITRGVAEASSSTPTAVERARLSPAAVEALADKFELLDVIGHGGMGVVYKARQKSLNRLVALKVVRATLAEPTLDERRSQAEAGTAALLDHPNIVPVYEVGEADGCTYFSMKLIEGGSLADHLDRFTKEPRAAAQLLVTIARAVYHAHQRGILHRDLKPSNILLQKTAGGQHSVASRNDPNNPPTDYCLSTVYSPYVTDFGLAKRLSEDGSLTQTGAIVGTPTYMAPEQALGKKGSVTTATDVYGLGAVLYAALTGRAPFRSDTPLATLAQVVDKDPEGPRSLNLLVDRDLETVCLKCLEKEPIRRYETAEALAQDLERWARGEPVEARPVGRLAYAWRWCRRKPLVAGLTALVGCLLMVGVAGLAIGFVIVSQARRAEAEQRVLLRQRLYAADMNRAHRLWQEGQTDRLEAVVAEYEPRSGEDDLRGFEWYYLSQLVHRSHPEARRTCRGHTNVVYYATYSPDGKTVASGGADGRIILWDAATGEKRPPLLGHTDDVNWLSFSPDGRQLASASDDKTIRLWNVASGKEEGRLTHRDQDKVECVEFSRDGKKLISGGWDRTVRIWNVASRSVEHQIPYHKGVIETVAFSPDGGLVASADHSGHVNLWNLKNGPNLAAVTVGRALGMAFAPDGTRFASVDAGGFVRLWETKSCKLLFGRNGHHGQARHVQFSSNGELFATCGDDGRVLLWSAADGAIRGQFTAHERAVWSVSFAPDGQNLATAGTDRTVRLWSLSDLAPDPRVSLQPASIVNSLCFSPDLQTLATSSQNGLVQLWGTASGQLQATFSGQSTDAWRLSFSRDGRFLTAAGGNAECRVWDLATQSPLRDTLEKNLTYPGTAAVLTPDKTTVISCSFQDATASELVTGALRSQIKAQDQASEFYPPSVTVSADGATAALGCTDGAVRLWDWSTPEARSTKGRHRKTVVRVEFAPDGSILASISEDGSIKLWRVATGEELATLPGYSQSGTLAFSPDGKTLASGSEDGAVKLWHVATGLELFTLEGHRQEVNALAFSSDGRTLMTAGRRDRTLAVECYSWSAAGNLTAWKKEKAESQPPSRNFTGLALP